MALFCPLKFRSYLAKALTPCVSRSVDSAWLTEPTTISLESPLGKAVMGKKVGERAEVKVSDTYSYYVTIKAIDKSTDDSEDMIRKF